MHMPILVGVHPNIFVFHQHVDLVVHENAAISNAVRCVAREIR